ncbi:MAG: MCE family protein [Isosphaeraceae bacterium]|nr:MCE family protein [Isosphaeraceae bacterium]
MSRASLREVRVGLVVIAGLAALVGLLVTAAGGPAFLASRRTVDVLFKDGQGIRVGSPVRVAGVDAGRVEAIGLVEKDGILQARVRLAIPADLAKRLRQDAKITIQSSLTGQGCVNIVSSGRSRVPLVAGQTLTGVETTMFDPILEQVGLGPVERSHLSHTIAQVRETVDAAGPRLRQTFAALQQATAGLRDMAEAIRPKAEAAATRLEELSQKIDAAKVEDTLNRVNTLTAHAEAMLGENRPLFHDTLTGVRDLTVTARDIAVKDRPKIDALLDGLNGTRARLDHVLTQAGTLTSQGTDMLVQNRANLDRTFANVRDASDYGSKLVQKLYGNPFYLSPFYKPTPEDIHAQSVYDAANTFLMGAKEFSDSVKTLQAMQAKAKTPEEQKAYQQLFNRAWSLTSQLNQTSRQLAEGMKMPPARR